jgi:heat-inducible transcriptional repressor
MIELSNRKRELLRRVVEEYVVTGQPVGSKSLVEHGGLEVSASTVRHELAELESLGLLTHPHTSAGRVPTESGYRLYAEELVESVESTPAPFPLDLIAMRTELETALQTTTETLSQATRLLALVSAPSQGAATVRHIEVLVLQPRVVMVVLITSAGGITKRVLELDEPVDPGLAGWAGVYLNERFGGVGLGTSVLRRRLDDDQLSVSERTFIDLVRPAFQELDSDVRTALYVGGAAGLLGEAWAADELEACRRLLDLLEHRAAALELLSDALDPRRTVVRVEPELEGGQLREVSYVGASYGLANRSLGTVGLLGPLRMDYEKAIRSVRAAAHELSRLVEEVYEEA